jgi:hypothetical protein
MTRSEFQKSFSLLESAFGVQNAERRQFYFHQFEHTLPWVFDRSIKRLIEIRDDGYGFPVVGEICTAIDEVLKRSTADERDLEAREFCQRCENRGFYSGKQNGTFLCTCRAGRLKQARLKLGLSARRTEVEEYARTELPPAEPPVRGLQERNPLGFWEDTQEEHDRWMARKRAEIEEIERRRAEWPEKPGLPVELRKKLLKDTVAGLGKRIVEPPEREPGEDEEDEEIPF